MKLNSLLVATAALSLAGAADCKAPRVVDSKRGITYEGLNRNGAEVFLGVPYAEDTSGAYRFKAPRPKQYARGAVVKATAHGPACPQVTGSDLHLFAITPVVDISEDCLNLVIGRPQGTTSESKLPVMVWIYGGALWGGQNSEITTAPDGLVRESVANGLPVISVAINYRIGVFGFAQSEALRAERSENAGLRDQRLALEWVRDNIGQFGGDPSKVTIYGQSSGGLSVGMQIMAYGGTKSVPFQQGIMQSQATEPGITANWTIDAMQRVVNHVGCNKSSLHSADTVKCLRKFDTNTILNASIATYLGDVANNVGDIWLPHVDGDFLPAAPSKLIKEGRFAKVKTMLGYCEDDLTLFTSPVSTDAEAKAFIQSYVPYMTKSNIDRLFSLYPVSEFPANAAAGLSSQFFRTARIFRDILMTCMPIHYAENLAKRGNDVYLYDWNQTTTDQVLKAKIDATGYGVIHSSELPYVFGNISVFQGQGYTYKPTSSDLALQARSSRSWSTFASTGNPSLKGHKTLSGFTEAFPGNDELDIFIIGGPNEGLSSIDGRRASSALKAQKLRERCAFINSDEIIAQLKY